MNFILIPFRQVYLQRSSERGILGDAMHPDLKRMTLSLGAVVVLPSLAFFILAPTLFEFYLGTNWMIWHLRALADSLACVSVH